MSVQAQHTQTHPARTPMDLEPCHGGTKVAQVAFMEDNKATQQSSALPEGYQQSTALLKGHQLAVSVHGCQPQLPQLRQLYVYKEDEEDGGGSADEARAGLQQWCQYVGHRCHHKQQHLQCSTELHTAGTCLDSALIT